MQVEPELASPLLQARQVQTPKGAQGTTALVLLTLGIFSLLRYQQLHLRGI